MLQKRLAFVLPLFFITAASAQTQNCTPGWVPTFGEDPGTNGTVHAATSFDDGSGKALYIGGGFTRAGGVEANGIAKFDGSRCLPLGNGVQWPEPHESGWMPSVTALAVFDDGSGPALIAGGTFTTAGNTPAYGLAKWDGAQWSTFGGASALLPRSYVTTTIVFDDGGGRALIVSGSLILPGGVNCDCAMWRAGTWSVMGSNIQCSANQFAVFDDGTGPALYAGGTLFNAIWGSRDGVARWSGNDWAAVGNPSVSPESHGRVTSLCVADLGGGLKLYAACTTGFYDHGYARVVKWDGNSWSAEPIPISWDSMWDMTMCTFNDGSGDALYLGDGATGMQLSQGGEYQFVLRWDGANLAPFESGAERIWTLLPVDTAHGVQLIVSGDIWRIGREGVTRTAMWDGTSWHPLGPRSNGPSLNAMLLGVFDAGQGPAMYVGTYQRAGSVPVHGIARWDGAAWTDAGAGLANDAEISSLADFDDGSGPALYAAGGLRSNDPNSESISIRWDGQQWVEVGTPVGHGAILGVADAGNGQELFIGGPPKFSGAASLFHLRAGEWAGVPGAPTLGSVTAIAQFDDGSGACAVFAGSFNSAGGLPVSGVTSLRNGQWSSLGGGLTWANLNGHPEVKALAAGNLGHGPELFVAGYFDRAGGVPVNKLASWDGTQWHDVGGGLEGYPYAMAIYDDGSGPALYVSESISTPQVIDVTVVARWDGTRWSRLPDIGRFYVRSMCTYDDGSCAGSTLLVSGMSAQQPQQYNLIGPQRSLLRWGCAPQCTVGFCFGDGSSASQLACPCANTGVAGRGCENSAVTGGAQLRASGDAFNDTLVLTSSGELANALSIFLQGDAQITNGALFGDGVRCVAGALKRMYAKSALGGVVSAPAAGDSSIRQQSANLGDPIATGTRRWYQVFYRDPDASFCAAPQGGTFNVSNGIEVRW